MKNRPEDERYPRRDYPPKKYSVKIAENCGLCSEVWKLLSVKFFGKVECIKDYVKLEVQNFSRFQAPDKFILPNNHRNHNCNASRSLRGH